MENVKFRASNSWVLVLKTHFRIRIEKNHKIYVKQLRKVGNVQAQDESRTRDKIGSHEC